MAHLEFDKLEHQLSKGDQAWFAGVLGESANVPVYIDLEENWIFWPVYEGSIHYREWMGSKKLFTMTVDRTLIEEYNVKYAAFAAVKEKMEQLYRVQNGLTPWESSPVPQHTLLIKPRDINDL